MGNYIAHRLHKIRHPACDDSASDARRIEAIERLFARRRETDRLEGERRRAAKMARALERRLERRSAIVDGTCGRRHTAARVAGVIIVSATAGMRTHSVSIRRFPNSAPSELSDVDIRFENEDDFAFYLNDPTIRADMDAIHLMRYAAPRAAEEMLMGSASAGADDRNKQSVLRLAESYMHKFHKRPSLSGDDRRTLSMKIIAEFEAIVALRLGHFHAEFTSLLTALMQGTRLSKRECDHILSRIYAGAEASRAERIRPRLLQPPCLIEAGAKLVLSKPEHA